MKRRISRALSERRWLSPAFAVALLCLIWLPISAFANVDVVQTENVNHVRSVGTTVTANPAGGKFSADKAADGKIDDVDHDSRWSSGDDLPARGDGTWLAAAFDKPTRLSYFKITFETRNAGAPPTPSNVRGFDIQYQTAEGSEWKTAKTIARTETVEGGGFEAVVKVELDTPVDATAVRLTNFDILAGSTSWNGVSVAEFEAYSNVPADAVDTPDTNHVKGATATASGYEDNSDKLKPAHAVDGRTDTRWSSGAAKPGHDEGTWLVAALKQPAKIQFLDIQFEERSIAVNPSNVRGFEVQYQEPGSAEWKSAKVVANTASGQGFEARVRVELEAPIIASKLRLTNFDVVAGNTQWNGVSVVELAAYTNVQPVRETLDGVIKKLNKMGEQAIASDVATLPVPEVPQGFSIELNGADFEQVIADDLSIHHPLTDKTVQVSWKVTKDGTDEKAVTKDIPYVVAGVHAPEAGKNAKPTVVPEIQEWYSDSTAKLAPGALTKVTYTSAELEAVVEEFAADYRDFTGIELEVVRGAAQAGAINFTLGAAAGDTSLGEEGYALQVKSDRIDVAAPAVTGSMYGMQTILQMCKLDETGFPVGQMRDYPRFEVRGFMWDVARKPVSLEMMQTVARTMRYYKMNDFQIHLSDNLIFLESYGEEKNQWQAYSAFRLETSVANSKGETPTAKDYAITKDQMRDFIQSERALGMNIVPEIDMPAHAVAFTKVWPELAVHNTRVTTAGSTTRSAIDHLDVRKPEARQLIRDVFGDYTRGENPVFDSDTVVHIGADEFIVPNGRPAYCEFYNDLVPFLLESGHTPRVWGSFDSSYLYGGGTEPADGSPLCTEVQMNIWSLGWANPVRMYNKGFSLINILDTYGYMVPNGTGNRGAYGDYLNAQSLYSNFDPNKFGGDDKVIPSGDKQMLGSAFAIWNDNIDTHACGLSESDEFARFFDALPVYAENNWAPTGQEKGAGNAGYQNLRGIVAKTGYGPNVNPFSEVSKKGDTYSEYVFEGDLADSSENGRDLTAVGGAAVEGGELVLPGGASYVEGPVDKIAAGAALSFDIELTRPAVPGDIIFEADAPYGTLDIRVMDDGKLGFTRELYTYYFDYVLPVGKKVRIQIETGEQKASLKVDGELVGDASGSFYNVDAGRVTKDGISNATFTLPLQRIGSKTSAIAAKIDNVTVRPASVDEPVDEYNKDAWQGRTNSQTLEGETAGGRLEHALDNDPSTIWHSNWKAATDDNVNGSLTVTDMIWAELDFDKGYEINQFSFTPRLDGTGSGRITRASLYVKTSPDGEYRKVVDNQEFANNDKTKTMSFETQTVFGVRLEVTDANQHGGNKYIAVSEFGIANKPARTNTVYVQGMSYRANDAGELDLSTGKPAGTLTGTAEDLDASGSVYRAEVKAGGKVTVTAEPDEGQEFVGWFAADSDEPLSTEASYKVPADYNVAFEARFKRTGDDPVTPPDPVKHEVTFMVDGKVFASVEVEDGKLVSAPAEDPAKDGYSFDGWFDGEDAFDFSTPVTGDLTLVAKFTKDGDGSGGTTDPDPGEKPGEGTDQKPGENPGSKPDGKPSGKPGDGLVATGDASLVLTALSMLGGAGLLAAGVAGKRRRK